jgi:hypothetical protein
MGTALQLQKAKTHTGTVFQPITLLPILHYFKLLFYKTLYR